MKYAQYLKALESDAPPEWRGKFLGYKRLKKAIKHLRYVYLYGATLNPSVCQCSTLLPTLAGLQLPQSGMRHTTHIGKALNSLSLSDPAFLEFFEYTCSAVAVSTESDGDRQLPQDAAFFALVHKEVLSVNK